MTLEGGFVTSWKVEGCNEADYVDPQPVSVGGSESEPLPRLELARRGDNYYMLWHGERPDPATSETYHLYFRYSEDGVKTLWWHS